MRRRNFFAGVLGLAVGKQARAAPRLMRAASADQLVESVGVCVHLDSEPFVSQRSAVRQAIGRLGVRYLRDEIFPGKDLQPWRALFAEFGVRAHLLTSPATNTVANLLDRIAALGPDHVAAIEGQNEGDSDWFRAQPAAGRDWASAVITHQRAIFEAVRTRFGGALPIIGPTVLDYKPDDMARLRPIAPFCDMAALHAYPQEQQEPETSDDYASLQWYLHAMRDSFKPDAPVMVTETGYVGGVYGVPPDVAAKYLPRQLLHAYSSGIVRTFIYELLDEGDAPAETEQNWGLMTPHVAPKPAYSAIAELIGALADPGSAVASVELSVGIDDAPPDARVLAFVKRNGELVLAAWRALPCWDHRRKHVISVPIANVRFTFLRQYSFASLVVGRGAGWSDQGRADHLTMRVSDQVTLLRLRP